jgi:hypothetical protein
MESDCIRNPEGSLKMLFHITSDGNIVSEINPSHPDGCGGVTFATEQELDQIVADWPMRRLVEVWNRLPGIRTVRRFEDRKIAVSRIWRALQPAAGSRLRTSERSSRRARARGKQLVFRQQLKAADVCALLRRAEGATLTEIVALTGWQPHTVRGFVSASVRKHGRSVRTFKRNGEHVYHLKC